MKLNYTINFHTVSEYDKHDIVDMPSQKLSYTQVFPYCEQIWKGFRKLVPFPTPEDRIFDKQAHWYDQF